MDYGFNFDSDHEYYSDEDEYFDSIDHEYFLNESCINYALCGCSSCDIMNANALVLNGKGTYFEWLPYELILMIIKMSREILNYKEKSYFRDYFDVKNGTVRVLRILRSKNLSSVGTVKLDTPFGVINGKKIFENNAAGKCYNDMAKLITETNDGIGIEELESIFNLMKKWLIWLCDHYHIGCWSRLADTIVSKIYEMDDTLDKIMDGRNKLTKKLSNLEMITNAKEITNKMKYFIEYYIPYAMLTRIDNYFDTRKDSGLSMYSFKNCLYNIYSKTRIHPNKINAYKVYEFEMEVYSPDYYNNVYLQYMYLRSGRRLIPKRNQPSFYWEGDDYIKRFI